MVHSGTFLYEIMAQVGQNQEKWHQADKGKDVTDFILIAQEQLGQMAKAAVEGDVGATHQECIHVAAILFEIYTRVTT